MISDCVLKMRELELESEYDESHNELSSDSDTCDSDEVDRLFTKSDNIFEKIIAKNKYILHIDASSENEPNIAVGLSDKSCEVYNLSNNQIAKITNLTEHNDKIIGCRFSGSDSNLLYTGSSDSNIKLWDIRDPRKSTINFLDTTVEDTSKSKVFNCFDVSCNERLLTAGTDLFGGDAFLLFWDIRNNKLLGGYWESHTDDITQVKFHPSNINKLASGSTDGLINVYDLAQSSEEDALTDTLNTESSVEHLTWFNENGKDAVCCITHTADLQLWNVDDAETQKHFTRGDIAKGIRKKSESYIYLTKSHKAYNYLLVLAGSNFRDGECLRGLCVKEGQIEPAMNFKENKQRVRSSWYNENTNILLTGGEKGILNVWRVELEKSISSVKKKK